jgi:hypothetical protein
MRTTGALPVGCQTLLSTLVNVSIVIACPSHSLLKHPDSLVVAVVLVHANKKAFRRELIEGTATEQLEIRHKFSQE